MAEMSMAAPPHRCRAATATAVSGAVAVDFSKYYGGSGAAAATYFFLLSRCGAAAVTYCFSLSRCGAAAVELLENFLFSPKKFILLEIIILL